MSLLRNDGYVNMDERGYLLLTEKGLAVAEKIYERHRVLTRALMNMGVDEKIAEEDACRIEHVISDESFNTIKSYVIGSAE